MRLVERRVEIAAPPSIVYELFTDADELVRWLATSAEVDPRPGGAIRWVHEDGAVVAGAFVELVPDRRIVFTYGWESGRFAEVAPGSTTVEITLRPIPSGTELQLVHRGLSAPMAEQHQRGWTWFLDRLADVAARSAEAP